MRSYLDGSDGNKWKLWVNGNQLTVTPGGNVGIGTTTPGYRLEVNGSVAGVRAHDMGCPLQDQCGYAYPRPGDGQRPPRGAFRVEESFYPAMNFESGPQLGFIAQELNDAARGGRCR